MGYKYYFTCPTCKKEYPLNHQDTGAIRQYGCKECGCFVYNIETLVNSDDEFRSVDDFAQLWVLPAVKPEKHTPVIIRDHYEEYEIATWNGEAWEANKICLYDWDIFCWSYFSLPNV